MRQFVESNWKYIIGVIFTAGVVYASLNNVRQDVDRSMETIKEHDKRITVIERIQEADKVRFEEIKASLNRIENALNTKRDK